MATYLIGDIQGCYDQLQRLLEKINFDPAADKLWCPGDLVNRGGQSLETLLLLHSLGKRFKMTLGNHDMYLLGLNYKFPDGGCKNRDIVTAPQVDALYFRRNAEAPEMVSPALLDIGLW